MANTTNISRRDFLKLTSAVAVGAGITGLFSQYILVDDAIAAFPASEGYLLVDTKKCQGCLSCMLACSLVHEERISPTHARIQIMQDSFEKFPDDLTMAQCRQCVDPECVKVCPSGALQVDIQNGNIRKVDGKKCMHCKACTEACPFSPSRAMWSYEDKRGLLMGSGLAITHCRYRKQASPASICANMQMILSPDVKTYSQLFISRKGDQKPGCLYLRSSISFNWAFLSAIARDREGLESCV